MFTGIVEDLGEVEAVEHLGDFARIHVRSTVASQDARPGDSISVNGVCLTVTGLLGGPPPAPSNPDAPPPPSRSGPPRGFTADVMGETLARTSLAGAHPGTKVNLERSVRMQDRLGGHLVQGHADGTAAIISRGAQQHWEVVRVSLPADLARYVVHKGSIAVDGVSLTVSSISATAEEPAWFEVSLIPETLKRTTLGLRQPGELVNLEVDVMAKYVEKLLHHSGERPPVPPEGVPDGKSSVPDARTGGDR
jgi:riboflavin synthase